MLCMSIYILLIKCGSVNISSKKKGDYRPVIATQDIAGKKIESKLMEKQHNSFVFSWYVIIMFSYAEYPSR